MRILEVLPDLGRGGAEKLVCDLILRLKENNEVALLILYEEKDNSYYELLVKNGIKIYTVNKKNGLDFRAFFKVNKIIKKYKPNIIHSHRYVNLYLSLYYLLNKKQIGFHTVHNLAEKEQFGIHRKFTKWLFYNRKVKPIAISNMVEDSIVKIYGIQKEKFYNIYNGIDLRRFYSDKSVSKTENFIAIGRLTKQKNYPLMLESFKKALQKYSHLTLTILGDGELHSEISNIIDELDLGKAVKLVGIVDDVENYVFKSDCLLMSSNYEGFGLVIAECMAAGLPVVATKAGAIVELVEDNSNGLLSEVGDVDAFSNNIIRMVEMNRNNTFNMSEKSKELSKKFDIDKCAKLYEEIFNKSLNEK